MADDPAQPPSPLEGKLLLMALLALKVAVQLLKIQNSQRHCLVSQERDQD
jgi:hypothetical protein